MILLAKRYQQNPQCAFPTFQMDVQMQSSIIHHVAKGFYLFEKVFILGTSSLGEWLGADGGMGGWQIQGEWAGAITVTVPLSY